MRHYCVIAIVVFTTGCGTQEAPETQAPETQAPETQAPVRSEIGVAGLPDANDMMPDVSPPVVGGKVMSVIDGDSIVVFNQFHKSLTVQLKGVDAPELAQKFGNTACEQLRERIAGKIVKLVLDEPDEFGRQTAEVLLDDESMNVWMIRAGCGWHNWKFDPDPAKALAEKTARSQRIGLWANDHPISPWDWKNPPDDGKLYIQGNGSRYHKSSCRTLDSRRVEILLEEATRSHKPCQVCEPPTE